MMSRSPARGSAVEIDDVAGAREWIELVGQLLITILAAKCAQHVSARQREERAGDLCINAEHL